MNGAQQPAPEPFELAPTNAIAGCLLIHGLTGSPPEMRLLGDYLAAQGFHCLAPLLPGHGTTLENLHTVVWQDWTDAAEYALEELQAKHTVVCAVGFSLGTLLVSHLAARHSELAAVALLSPAVSFANRLVRLATIVHRMMPTFPKEPDQLRAKDAREHIWCYDRWSTHALGETWRLQRHVRREMPDIQVPALVIHSHQDNALSADAGQKTLALWGSPDKELLTLHRSDHGLLLDIERDVVFERVSQFLIAHVPA